MPDVAEIAARDYDTLLGQGDADGTRLTLERETLERRLLFNDQPLCNVLRPNFISAATYQRVQHAARLAVTSLACLHDHALRDKETRQRLGIDRTQEEMMLVDGAAQMPSVIGRLDGLMSPEGSIKFIEYNTVPFGVFLMDGLAEAFRETPAMRRFGERYSCDCPSTRSALLETIDQVYGTPGARTRLNFACIGSMPGPTLTEFELFLACMKENGHKVLVVPPDARWTLRDQNAFVEDLKVDVALMFPPVAIGLVEKYGRTHPLLRAVAAGNAHIFNGLFRTEFLGSKLSFSALSDPAFAHLLDSDTVEQLAHVIPWTRIVRPARTTYDGTVVDLMPFLEENRERLVLKPARSFGGNGVLLGSLCDPADWSNALARSREEPLVAQERVIIATTTYPDLVDGRLTSEAFYSDLNVYTWKEERAAGCLVRISPDPILNLTAGRASAVPTFVVQPRET